MSMKQYLLAFLIWSAYISAPGLLCGQVAPALGLSSSFAVFTASGALNNLGPSVISGDIGTASGPLGGFPPGVVVGQTHVADAVSVQAGLDVQSAYMQLGSNICGMTIGASLGNGQLLTPNVYCIGLAATLSGNLTLDAGGDPNALFIFLINGPLSTAANSGITLVNGATACNVYWRVAGAVILGNNTAFQGTILSGNTISFSGGATLFGRALTTSGIVSLNSNTIINACPSCTNATVNPVPNQIVCQGNFTTSVNFTGTPSGIVFNWVNNNPGIGLPPKGTGNIAAFAGVNNGVTPAVATITVIPQFTDVNGALCFGTPRSFTITLNPAPIVDAGDPAFICPGSVLNISTLGAGIVPNGSGVTGGIWSTSGTGVFGPNNGFPAATTYTPSAIDIANGFVTLILTTSDPTGPCTPVADGVSLTIHQAEPLTCNNLVYVALDVDCVNEILPDDILEGVYQSEFYNVQLYTQNNIPLPGGNIITSSNVGQILKARVFDICTGNFCWGNIKVEDKLDPDIECTDITLSCAITTYTPAYLLNVLNIPTAYPEVFDCSTFTLTYVDTWQDLSCGEGFNGHPDLSAYLVRKWTAKDASNNSSTCIQYIYFERRHLGDVLFPADVTISCSDIINTNPSNTGAPHFNDFGLSISFFPNDTWCEMQATYADQSLPVCDGTYKILRTWTVYDWCLPLTPFPPQANPMTYIQVIKIMDGEGPQFTCPTNLTVTTDPFNCCATTNLPDAVITDNCSRINKISAMVVTFDPYTGSQTGMYPVGGTLTTFPGNNIWNPDTLGNWGITPCLPQGSHRVIYTAEDDCGNSSSCSFRLAVADYIPPVAACDQTTIVAINIDDPFDCYTPADGCDGAGVTWLKATTFDDGSTDNCNNLHFTVRRMAPYSDCIQNLEDCEYPVATEEQDSIKFYCCEVGTTQTVILRVYQVDFNGNYINDQNGDPIYNECMVQVEVQDKIKPVCLPPANVTVSCENFDPSLWVYGNAGIFDNCCLDSSLVYQGQCGMTHTANYNLFDTVCNRGTITRTFRAFDCHGGSSQCTQRIVVNYEQDYFIKFPNDVIVSSCDGTGIYGEPIIFGEDCELLGINYEDVVYTVVPDACFKIERTWTIINWCTYNPNLPCIEIPNPNPNATVNHPSNLPGPTVSACGTPPPWNPTVVKINPTDPLATNYCIFYDSNANCYRYKQIIKIIDTQDPELLCPASPVEFCDLTPNDPLLWNETYWWDNATELHDLCEGPADLRITATDACSGMNINIEYQLFLDLDGDGAMETVVTSVNFPGWNNVQYGNAANPNFTGGTPRQFDERPVPFSQKWGFAVQESMNGNNKTAAVRWNTLQQQSAFAIPELPYGTHKIKWLVSDGCGNETVCEYNFVVKDCKAPTVVCQNGLSVNIMPTGMVTMWASDFLQYGEDNCTPADKLKFGIRKSGTGTGFPLDGNGNPVTSVTFTCDELGTQIVELWVIDLAGNAAFCETYVIVQDNMSVCPPTPGSGAKVAGVLVTELAEGVEDGNVAISGSGPGIPTFTYTIMTNDQGAYNFNAIPLSSNSTITPVKDDNPLSGVTTYDLVLISKHILDLEPLNTPYKIIAADANKNNSVTAFDIVEFRKLILGIYNDLPNNTSWRFVDKSFGFTNASNPFVDNFPENRLIVNLASDKLNEDFVSIKVGDVNNTVIPNVLGSADDRSGGTLLFDVSPPQRPRKRDAVEAGGDYGVQAGETFTLHFKAAERVQGYQFTLSLTGLEILDIQPGAGMAMSNFGVFSDLPASPAEAHNTKEGSAITTSFNGNEQGEFAVSFRALKSGKISEMIGVSSRITKAESYSQNGAKQDVALRFSSPAGMIPTIVGIGFELYQNQPNPFVNKTYIGFNLPEAGAATLTVYDETGRMLYSREGNFDKGYNTFGIDLDFLQVTSVLYYKVETATDVGSKKMIRTK